ncbi:MAG TPA: polysaccharide export protein, partial [Bacteroidia bacterium]|nr:polysaccharide export protein [Bacteroidia bacterium]
GHISHPVVSVKFVNNNITILGEVAKAGTYAYPNEKLSLFNALGLAGDITEYGNRKKVTLIRESNNSIHKYNLDLTQDDIFKSEFYYLRPNDVVYVEPLKIRRFGMKEYPFTLIVSAITSAFLILYYVKK